MNRNEMRAVLADGGTVLHKGRHIQRDSELPSEGELALDNGTELDALQSVQREVARLTAEKLSLEKSISEKKAAKEAKAVEKVEAKAEPKASEPKADAKAEAKK